MIVFHGSNQIVKEPDVSHSFRSLDFGGGFYVTTVREQAVRWARRKALFSPETATLNIYQMNEDGAGLKILDFGEDLSSWIKFVCDCRDGGTCYRQFDVIKGKVADDKVFRVVDMYHSGAWDIDRAIKEMKAYSTYDQMNFVTQNAIDRLLKFERFEKVSS
ncbi:MAG: DUF3990 domain-containing protein [Fibrobacteraceae bacterium]|nr:DUF3990 domain-containing protein [Fibrobacteraceae bacterium]